MNYSAKDLFPDHYTEGIKRDASPEELKMRRATIDRLLPETDILKWVLYIKIYWGIVKEENSEYLSVVEEFKTDDENFLVKNNNLLRLLLGLLIIEKIEQNSTFISDFLGLSVITHALSPQEIFPQLYNYSANFWIEECERKRSVIFPKTPVKIKASLAKVVLPAVEGTPYPDSDSFQTFKTSLNSSITSLVKDANAVINGYNSLIDYTSKLQTAYSAVAEETNVLWWLFGGYSDLLKKPFQLLSPEGLSIVVAIELARHTKIIPGIGKVDNIINRPLSILSPEQAVERPLGDLIGGITNYTEELKQELPKIDVRLTSFCPFLFGLQTAIEYADVEWKAIFIKTTGINLERTLSLQQFSGQLYKELSLLRIFKTFNVSE
ncbi:GTPase-associated system all-helical protein GASH [uncultured Mucilaginibacter sp.]|uniref:GTPase-associated system all-helical protein GASH n=1 Tax=uncultured Mucilaginibacter sp. TaxID=797541 RepID=UPI0025CC7874|nr:GTPase-associated system all-helical protein GASH [uncultured Mucilaginibacter sp.]